MVLSSLLVSACGSGSESSPSATDRYNETESSQAADSAEESAVAEETDSDKELLASTLPRCIVERISDSGNLWFTVELTNQYATSTKFTAHVNALYDREFKADSSFDLREIEAGKRGRDESFIRGVDERNLRLWSCEVYKVEAKQRPENGDDSTATVNSETNNSQEEATTSTSPTTTTTTPSQAELVVEQVFLVQQLASGAAEEVRLSLVNAMETLSEIDRVDVMSFKVGGEYDPDFGVMEIVASTGYLTEEYQQSNATSFLSTWATFLWIPEFFGNMTEEGKAGLALDLTLDDQNWFIPASTMIDIAEYRTSAAQILGF